MNRPGTFECSFCGVATPNSSGRFEITTTIPDAAKRWHQPEHFIVCNDCYYEFIHDLWNDIESGKYEPEEPDYEGEKADEEYEIWRDEHRQ